MSDFLSKLYEEEMSKTGSSEFVSIMQALPKDELEAYLGVKMAADSHPPVEAPADDGKRPFVAGSGAKPQAKRDDEAPETNVDEALAKKAASEPASKYDAIERFRRIKRLAKGQKKEELRQSSTTRGVRQGAVGGILGALAGTAAGARPHMKTVVEDFGDEVVRHRGPHGSVKGGIIGGASGLAVGAGLGALRGIAKARAARRVASKDTHHTMIGETAKREQEKKGSVERVLDVMQKMAVAGPTIPQLPDSEGGHLQAKQNKIHHDVNAGNPQKVTVPVDHQGPGKTAVEVDRDGRKVTTTKEAMAWADGVGRGLIAAELEETATQGLAMERAKIAMTALNISRDAPEHIKTAAIAFAGTEVAKTGLPFVKAAEDDGDYPVKPKSWWAGRKGQTNASTLGPGLGRLFEDPALQKRRVRNQLAGIGIGGAGGAGAGALAGLLASALSKGKISTGKGAGGGAAIGGIGGAAIGEILGMSKARREHLQSRGIKQTGLGFGRGRFTEEAAKKYLK